MLLQIGTNGKRMPQRCGFEVTTAAAIQHLWNIEEFFKAMAESRLSAWLEPSACGYEGPRHIPSRCAVRLA
jgi:hypothetical protein